MNTEQEVREAPGVVNFAPEETVEPGTIYFRTGQTE